MVEKFSNTLKGILKTSLWRYLFNLRLFLFIYLKYFLRIFTNLGYETIYMFEPFDPHKFILMLRVCGLIGYFSVKLIFLVGSDAFFHFELTKPMRPTFLALLSDMMCVVGSKLVEMEQSGFYYSQNLIHKLILW